jgi:D-alanyl-D-alanine carboxypeptidase
MNIDPNAPHLSAEQERHLVESVAAVLAETSTPGVSAALLVDGRPLWVSTVGFADWEHTRPLETHDRFFLYSITKTLIATLILQLAEQERVALDAPFQTYLPGAALATPVSIRQLLHHTGGIPDYGGLPAYFEALKADPRQPWSDETFLSVTLAGGLRFAPGEGWAYSNIGFLLLRKVIETVLGTSLRAALSERIFAPLNLQNAFTAQTLDDTRALTPGFSNLFSADGSFQDVRGWYHPGWVSHGVVISTALELARMVEGVFHGPLLRPESRSAMLQAVDVPVRHPFFQRPGYGLGVMIDPVSRYGLMAGHGGGGPGYSAGVLHLPSANGRRITSAAFANSDAGDSGLPIAFRLAMLAAEM